MRSHSPILPFGHLGVASTGEVVDQFKLFFVQVSDRAISELAIMPSYD